VSCHWFRWIESKGLIGHHLLGIDPVELPVGPSEQEMLKGRIMICRKTQVVPIECVARGYLTGSGWKEYQRSGSVCGIPLPDGLRQCDRLPEPIFTPSTKATDGHDENITFEQACGIAGTETMNRLRDLTLSIFSQGCDYAAERGIIIADTKFEFGHALDANGKPTDELLIIDEVLTSDSSRFWPADDYEPGRDQASFDKQYVRNHLQALVDKGEWDKTPPAPEVPEEVVINTIAKYREARDRLFG
jgi:phosphoribosylaminoimidazole-succinocarboxamide synthase